jgi:hypothetical protein
MNFGNEAIDFGHFLQDVYSTTQHISAHTPHEPAVASLSDLVPANFIALMNKKVDWAYLAINYRYQVHIGNLRLDRNEPARSPAAKSKSAHEFIDLLSRCRHQITSDPRDQVYALLGLADDVIRAEIDPRYHETVTETFVRTAKKVIGLQRSLYVWSQASEDQSFGVKDLPS